MYSNKIRLLLLILASAVLSLSPSALAVQGDGGDVITVNNVQSGDSGL